MNDSTSKENIKKWIETWQRAARALESVKLKELRSPDYYRRNLKLLNEMLKYAFMHLTVRETSGLVEQQKLFMKYHQKMYPSSTEN